MWDMCIIQYSFSPWCVCVRFLLFFSVSVTAVELSRHASSLKSLVDSWWCWYLDIWVCSSSYLTGIRPSEAHVHLWLPQHGAGYIEVVSSSHRLWRRFKAHKWWTTGNCRHKKGKQNHFLIMSLLHRQVYLPTLTLSGVTMLISAAEGKKLVYKLM